MVKNNNNNKYHIIGIIGLTLIIFSILFLTTGDIKVNVKENFNDNISFNKENLYSTLEIGDITIKNTEILPQKYMLEEYVICDKQETYIINYNMNFNRNFYSYNSGRKYIEISSKENAKFNLNTNFGKYQLINKLENENLQKIEFGLYTVPINEDSYSYCFNKKEENFIKNIVLNINITKEDLENLK